MPRLPQPPPPQKRRDVYSAQSRTASPARTRGACPARTRGAQPGNRNALKHGFYTPRFHQQERKALEQLPISDLQEEIKLLRAFLRRYLQELESITPGDHKAVQDAIFTACLVSSQLVALARVQNRGQFFTAESGFIRAWAESLMKGEPVDDEHKPALSGK